MPLLLRCGYTLPITRVSWEERDYVYAYQHIGARSRTHQLAYA